MITATDVAQMTPEQMEEKKAELYKEKTSLLNTFGIFGGGPHVNDLHRRINNQLELLGVDPES
jgi:hypothetical protein